MINLTKQTKNLPKIFLGENNYEFIFNLDFFCWYIFVGYQKQLWIYILLAYFFLIFWGFPFFSFSI